MLDRESTFTNEAIVDMLKNEFVPVAFDQWYTRSQDDAEGDFYRMIASQGPRDDMENTTQGFYVTDASGKLFGYNNNRHGEPVEKIMRQMLEDFDNHQETPLLEAGEVDPQYARLIPEGALVVRVNAKVLGGYEETDDQYLKIFQSAISRDNLWILADEKAELLEGRMPETLARRIARFTLIDSTRGEPLMWTNDETNTLSIEIAGEGIITGYVEMISEDGERGYRTWLRGVIQIDGDMVQRFDLVARGVAWGDGPYTPNAPEGEFPLAVAFRLADGTDVADSVAPQGSKGWGLDGYLLDE